MFNRGVELKMRRELVLTAMVSAVIGAGLMLLATGGRPPAGIEGWTPVNAEVSTALGQESAGAGSKAPVAASGGSDSVTQQEAAVGQPSENEAGNGSVGEAGGSPGTTASTAGGDAGPGAAAAGAGGTVNSTDGIGESASSTDTGRISINRAGLAELQEIPGIGEKKAQAILEYRKTHGTFASIDELTQVKGIGDKMLEKMKPYIGL
jgi:competence protein ComEA